MATLEKQIERRKNHFIPFFKRTIRFRNYNIYWWIYPIGVTAALIEDLKRVRSVKDKYAWSDVRAKKMADKYFGLICQIDEEDESLFFCYDSSSKIFARVAKPWHKTWLRINHYKMNDFILKKYNIEGYKKIVETQDDYPYPNITTVTFIKEEE